MSSSFDFQPHLSLLRTSSGQIINLGRLLFPLLALALEMPEEFFSDKITKPAVVQRLLYYPPLPAEDLAKGKGKYGIGVSQISAFR